MIDPREIARLPFRFGKIFSRCFPVITALALAGCSTGNKRDPDDWPLPRRVEESLTVDRSGGDWDQLNRHFADDFNARGAFGFLHAVCQADYFEAYKRTAARARPGGRADLPRFTAFIQGDPILRQAAQFTLLRSEGETVTARVTTVDGAKGTVELTMLPQGREGRLVEEVRSVSTFR